MCQHQSLLGEQIIAAEVKFTNFLVEHNVPLAASDHAGALFKSMFPDSKIAAGYSAARTRTTALLNVLLDQVWLTLCYKAAMRNVPFSLRIDGSSDQELKKMYSLTVRIWDVNEGRVSGCFVKVCTTADGTAQEQYELIESFLKEESLRWDHCVGLSVDNAAVNMGIHSGLKSLIEKKNPSMYTMGCPCHILHNAATHASKAFTKITGFNPQDFFLDLYYHFDHSSKKKNAHWEFNEFCGQEYKEILKHVSTRWLSCEKVNERVLNQFPSLSSYFLSQKKEKAVGREKRLINAFEDENQSCTFCSCSQSCQSFHRSTSFCKVRNPGFTSSFHV